MLFVIQVWLSEVLEILGCKIINCGVASLIVV